MESRRVTLPTALGRESVRRLLEALEAAERDPATRIITLVGSEEAFCRGLDLADLVHGDHSEPRDPSGRAGPCAPLHGAPAGGGRALALRDFIQALLCLRSATKPTIALVDGQASGGGVGLAAACDLVICTERASFAFPEVLFGLVPAMVLPLVLERMSPQRARLWALTGSAHGPEEALAAGLADVVVPSAALEREHERWLRKLGRGHARGVAELKRSTRTLPLSLEQAIERGLELTSSALDDEAVVSAVRSFLDDGAPPWES